jgi:dihydrofolate reductase
VDWHNTTLVRDDAVGTIRRMKAEPGSNLAILGSGSIVTQLANAGLIDTFQVIVNPIALGAGRSFLAGVKKRLNVKLTRKREFRNGSLMLVYGPAR